MGGPNKMFQENAAKSIDSFVSRKTKARDTGK